MDFDKLSKLDDIFRDLYNEAMEVAVNFDMLDAPTPTFVLELHIERDTVTGQIFSGIMDWYQENEKLPSESTFPTVGLFCLLAGMGAVAHWHCDYASLKENGIYKTLSDPRGISELDDYVLDAVGLKEGSKERKDFSKASFVLSQTMIDRAFDEIENLFPDAIDNPDRYFSFTIMEIYKVLYDLGVTIEMHRLNMR